MSNSLGSRPRIRSNTQVSELASGLSLDPALAPMEMLRDARTAGLVKSRCGDQAHRQRQVWAVHYGRHGRIAR